MYPSFPQGGYLEHTCCLLPELLESEHKSPLIAVCILKSPPPILFFPSVLDAGVLYLHFKDTIGFITFCLSFSLKFNQPTYATSLISDVVYNKGSITLRDRERMQGFGFFFFSLRVSGYLRFNIYPSFFLKYRTILFQ